MCTVAEAEANCLAGSGCGHDAALIWTSDTGYSLQSEALVALPLLAQTSTEEPMLTVQDNDTNSRLSDGAILGIILGMIMLLAVVGVMYARHSSRAEQPGGRQSAKDVDLEEGATRLKWLRSVRRANPSFEEAVGDTPLNNSEVGTSR